MYATKTFSQLFAATAALLMSAVFLAGAVAPAVQPAHVAPLTQIA
jgi:hypothetical protein